MKAYDIYKKSLALLFEREGEDKTFKDNFCAILTSVAAETLPYENSLRESNGEEKLLKSPEISDMEDEVCMCDEICTLALPYGVAAHFADDDGESVRSAIFRERFLTALYGAKKHVFRDVEDVYGGENI